MNGLFNREIARLGDQTPDKGFGINGIDWVQDDSRTPLNTYTTYGRVPAVEVFVVEGDGRFLNDIRLPGMYHVAFLRSQHAHARIVSIDTSRAPGTANLIQRP